MFESIQELVDEYRRDTARDALAKHYEPIYTLEFNLKTGQLDPGMSEKIFGIRQHPIVYAKTKWNPGNPGLRVSIGSFNFGEDLWNELVETAKTGSVKNLTTLLSEKLIIQKVKRKYVLNFIAGVRSGILKPYVSPETATHINS
ncbi:hypothetical protein HOD83_03070 [Candidatus Woesearchaeota archaeon]|nr:hypothetical protein [Candidatus Woesearchaeota archaeon]